MDSIGQMDHLITFQEPITQSDGAGGLEETWQDFATDPTVWAEIQPLYGNERILDGARNASGAWIFKVYNRTDVTERDRILVDGEPYNISRIMRRGPRELYLSIEAVRGMAQ